MKRTATRDLLTYWTELRANPANADRAASASAGVQLAVSHSFLVEAHAAGDFKLRISGLGIDRLFIGSMRHAGFPRLWKPGDREPIKQIMRTAMDEALPLVAGVRAAPAGCEPLDLELILLPLTHGGATDGLLGGITPATIPPWYGVEAITSFSLGPCRFLIDPFARGRRPIASRTPNGSTNAMALRSRFAVIEGGLNAASGRLPVSGF